MRPGRLFHAVVLAGATLGAGSCRRASLGDGAMNDGAAQVSDGRVIDGGGTADVRIDQGTDLPGIDLGFDRSSDQGADVRDAGGDEPYDAGCDVVCPGGFIMYSNCTCGVGIA